jgi:hypothetical protein
MVSENQAKMQPARFAAFADLGERLSGTASRLERARLVREYLATLAPEEAETASRWLVGRPFPESEGRRLSLSGRALVVGAIVLLTATFASLILQQQQRHRQAKRTLIELERALGLFEPDTFASQRPLYPNHWQTDWTGDRSTILSLVLLGLLTFLALVATILAS